MTSPLVVGSVAVEVSASARGLAKSLRDAVVKEFKGAGLDKALTQALGKTKIKVPVQPVFDKKNFPDAPSSQRAPRSSSAPKSDTDLVLRAFQQDVAAQLRSLSRQAVKIPVEPDDGLRAGVAEQIAEVQKRLKVDVPVEPAGRREYEQNLRRMLADVAGKVKLSLPAPEIKEPKPVKVPVQIDPLTKAFQAEIQKQIAGLSKFANAKIPVTADTAPLRERAAAAVAQVERTLKAEIPTEPGSRAAYEAKLRAMVAEATRTVHATIPVDVDRNRFQRAVASLASSLPQGLGSAFQRIGEAANSAGAATTSAMGSAAAALTQLVNPAVLAAVAIGGTVAAMFLVGPAAGAAAGGIAVLGGALGSLPAFASAGGAAFATFGLALRGVADRFKDTAKAGGGAGSSIAAQGRQIAAAQRSIEQANRGVAAAERGLQNAQRESLRAQQAINLARKQAVDRIADLGRALRGAALDEEDARLRIDEAQAALDDAQASHDPLEIRRAELALKQARLAAEDASEAASDLATEKAEADRRGVEGSDEVTAAFDRQRSAQEQVTAAQDSLMSAQDSLIAANEQLATANEKVGSSAATAAEKMIPLSPAALAFVDAIKKLKPAFEDLRLSVQERFFTGLDKTVSQVSSAWLPQLKTTLGQYADTFNGFFKNLGTSVSQPEFIKNIAAGMESVRKAAERIGEVVSGPLVDAFGRLSKASGPFIEALGDEIADLLTDFSGWVKSADNSGKLTEFFKTATGYLHDFFDIGRSVGSIIKSLIEIIFGSQGEEGSGVVESFQRLADFLKDPENQRKLQEYIGKFVAIGKFLLTEVVPAIMKFVFFVSTATSSVRDAGNSISNTFNLIKGTIGGFVTDALLKFEQFKMAVSGAILGAAESVRDSVERIKTMLGSLGGPLQSAGSAFGRFRDGAISAIGSVVNTAQGIAGRISNAVGSLGTLLYNAGKNVIQGLINGMTYMLGHLGNAASNVASTIRAYLPFSPAKKGPLSGAGNPFNSGQSIARLVASGVTSNLGVVEASADDLASRYLLATDPLTDLGGFGSASLSAPAPVTPRLLFGGDAPDSFMAWIRNNTRIDYGGSAQAAIGTGVG